MDIRHQSFWFMPHFWFRLLFSPTNLRILRYNLKNEVSKIRSQSKNTWSVVFFFSKNHFFPTPSLEPPQVIFATKIRCRVSHSELLELRKARRYEEVAVGAWNIFPFFFFFFFNRKTWKTRGKPFFLEKLGKNKKTFFLKLVGPYIWNQSGLSWKNQCPSTFQVCDAWPFLDDFTVQVGDQKLVASSTLSTVSRPFPQWLRHCWHWIGGVKSLIFVDQLVNN